ETVLLLADGGRAEAVEAVLDLLNEGRRVVAIDPYDLGESTPESRGYLWALMVASVGERPLGVQVGQVAAAAGAFRPSDAEGPVSVEAIGPRSSVIALVAAALAPEAIGGL